MLVYVDALVRVDARASTAVSYVYTPQRPVLCFRHSLIDVYTVVSLCIYVCKILRPLSANFAYSLGVFRRETLWFPPKISVFHESSKGKTRRGVRWWGGGDDAAKYFPDLGEDGSNSSPSLAGGQIVYPVRKRSGGVRVNLMLVRRRRLKRRCVCQNQGPLTLIVGASFLRLAILGWSYRTAVMGARGVLTWYIRWAFRPWSDSLGLTPNESIGRM